MENMVNGDIRKLFFKYLWASVGGAVAVAAYSLVDMIAIGQGVGPNGTAAIAVVNPIYCVQQMIALVFGVGGSVLMSMAKGAGETGKARAYYTASAILTTVVTVLIWIPLFVLKTNVYQFFGADDVILPYTTEYGIWIIAFFPGFVIVTMLGCFIRCDDHPRLVMMTTLIGAAINMFGDWFLVFPMHMGMTGAAIATVSGIVVQTFIMIGYCLNRKTGLKFEMPYKTLNAFRKIVKTGIASGVPQFSVIVVAFIANNQIMKYAGNASLSVYGMLSTVGSLFMGIYTGVGEAVQPISSVNYGAGRQDLCRKIFRLGFICSVVFGLLFMGMCELLPMQVTGVFMRMTADVELVAKSIVRIYSLCFLPLSVSIYISLYWQSVGEAAAAFIISLLRGLVLNSILLVLLPFVFGENGIWWAVTVAEYIVAIAAIVRYMLKKD